MVRVLNFDFSMEYAKKHGKPTKYELGKLYFHINSGELHVCIAKFDAGPMMCAIGRYNKPKVMNGTMFVPAMIKPISRPTTKISDDIMVSCEIKPSKAFTY